MMHSFRGIYPDYKAIRVQLLTLIELLLGKSSSTQITPTWLPRCLLCVSFRVELADDAALIAFLTVTIEPPSRENASPIETFRKSPSRFSCILSRPWFLRAPCFSFIASYSSRKSSGVRV